jgi:uncharacterized phage-like protein YoqJ
MFERETDKFYVAGTGHRPHYFPGGHESLEENMKVMMREIDKHVSIIEKDVVIISGMALGFDTALAIYAIKHDLPLVCAVPCKGQENSWPDRSKTIYNKILEKAQFVEYISDKYAPWVMQKRNVWMADRADLLLACWNRQKKGGTYNCLKYAFKNDILVKNLYTDCGF